MKCCVWDCISQRSSMPFPMVLDSLRSLHLQLACPVSSQKSNTVFVLCCCCSVAKLSPTLRDTMDCSPPGSSVHGIPQGRVLDWVAISFFRDLPDQGIESVSPALAGGFFSTEPPGTPVILFFFFQLFYNLICHLYDNNIKSSSSQHIFPFSCCSVAKSCLTLCQLDCNSSGLPVHHCLLELAETHVH